MSIDILVEYNQRCFPSLSFFVGARKFSGSVADNSRLNAVKSKVARIWDTGSATTRMWPAVQYSNDSEAIVMLLSFRHV
jgi:hypothetical protein